MENPYKHLKTIPGIHGYPEASEFKIHEIYSAGDNIIQVFTAQQNNVYTAGIKIRTEAVRRTVYPSLRNGGFNDERSAVLYAIGKVLGSSQLLDAQTLCEIHRIISEYSQKTLF